MATTTKEAGTHTARLTLTIDGTEYVVRSFDAFARGLTLTRTDAKVGKIRHTLSTTGRVVVCDCESYRYSKAIPRACKHTKAAQAVKLL